MGALAARTLELAESYPVTWRRICELGGIPTPAASIHDTDDAADGGPGDHRVVLKPDGARADVLAALRIAALQVAARMRELTDERLDRVVEGAGRGMRARSVECLITTALIRRTHDHFERMLLMGC
jgi:hypothetical protein